MSLVTGKELSGPNLDLLQKVGAYIMAQYRPWVLRWGLQLRAWCASGFRVAAVGSWGSTGTRDPNLQDDEPPGGST
eukprot:7105936-Pyramimonas_sp.AAC.1